MMKRTPIVLWGIIQLVKLMPLVLCRSRRRRELFLTTHQETWVMVKYAGTTVAVAIVEVKD